MAIERKTRVRGAQVLERSILKGDLDATGETVGFVSTVQADGSVDWEDSSGLAAVSRNEINIVLNAFRIAVNGSLSQFNMVDGIVDEYEDENSIDNPNSTNESYDSVNDLYSPSKDTEQAFAHMLLEDNTDEGTGANAVTDIGTPTYTAGKLNNALTLDGSTDALNLDALKTDIASDTTGSIAMWIKKDALSATATWFSIGDTDGNSFFRMRLDTSGHIQIRFITSGVDHWRHEDTGETLHGALSAGTWYHIVIVQDGISPKVYIDSVDVTVLSITADVTVWFSDIAGLDNGRLGCLNQDSAGNTLFWDGQIDDFRYFQNTALIQTDIDFLYNSGTGTENEIEGNTENMTLISDSFTAEAVPDNARIVLFEEDVDSITLNTDLKYFVTRDAGQTFTTDFASDDKLDITSHGFSNDDRIMVTSSSQDLPIGLDSATVYYVINATTNDFELSLISSGSAVELTDNGTGTHTVKQVSEITLSNDGEYESGKNILTGSVDISGQPSGTSMEYNLITANNKDLKIHCAGYSWD